MKPKIFNTCLILMSLSTFFSCSTDTYLFIKNPTNLDVKDYPVILSKESIAGKMSVDSNLLIGIKDENDNFIPSQCDDMNDDSSWDEVFLLVDIKAGESKKLKLVTLNSKEYPVFENRTNIRFAPKDDPTTELNNIERLRTTDSPTSSKHFQMEGPAWENDKVAFRNYFDARNGIDIFGKRISMMVMDQVGLPGSKYHELDDWGMDILKVGNSLGAGAIALEINDSVYRISESESSVYKKITEGPLRSAFKFEFRNCLIAGNSYDIEQTISIWGGANFYHSSVKVNGLRGKEKLVTGIVNMHSDTVYTDTANNVVSYMYTHDNQAFDGEKLGMGITFKEDDFVHFKTAPESGDGIIETYMVSLSLYEQQPTTFNFYSGWEYQNPLFSKRDGFEKLLISDAEILTKVQYYLK